ncbi:MAG: histidine kinase [Succiniclasticum sp.]|jgi:signal transduction histidine kinase
MTITKRLVLSHILTFFLPWLLFGAVILLSIGGLALFAMSGNKIYAETPTQFQRISMAVHHFAFQGIRDVERGEVEPSWVLELLDGEYNYFTLVRNGETIYSYGNPVLKKNAGEDAERAKAELADSPGGSTRYIAEGKNNYYMEKRVLDGVPVYLYYYNRIAPHASDEAFEHALHGTEAFLALAMLVFIILSSWFLSRFVLRHIVPPLHNLKEASEKIYNGDLSVRIEHPVQDEFSPVVGAFNLMAIRLQESLRIREEHEENRKELIASISHDIRTPLTAIKAYVEGLKDNVHKTEDMRHHYLDVIDHKTDDLNRMVEQLFLLSKLDLGERAVPMEILDLAAALRRIQEENELAWQESGVVFTTVLPDDPVPVRGNHMLFARILQNLVSNSAKYKTQPEAHVLCQLQKLGDSAVWTVCDDGPGVQPDQLARLTEPFYRTDKARSHTSNGSGIGLTIVERSVALMQGTITIKNAVPSGLQFTITFPLTQEDPQS